MVTYETVREDLKVFESNKKSNNLFKYKWLRIILDEANKIQNQHS